MSTPVGAPGPLGDLTPQLLDTDRWTDRLVEAAGIPVLDVPFVSVGGGLGSFVLVDLLRIAGVPTDQIRVLTGADYPWQQYEYLARCSQIPLAERLRSDSASVPDNVWGFPSLAMREMWRGRTLRPAWNVLTEPVLTDFWTPRLGAVFEGMAKEATRIGWSSMVLKGQVRMVRRREGGGYFTLLTPPAGATRTRRVAARSRFVHLAVGYPGVKFLDDLQAYRTTYQDTFRVVNAYEPHEHVYDELLARPGTVVVRGSGIVASRVLQRLVDDRDRRRARTTIVHIFRTYVSGAHGDSVLARRRGGDGWAYQGFSHPKAVWGGQHWNRARTLEGEARADFHRALGGTTTPPRRAWREQLRRGRAEGWYRQVVGTVKQVEPGPGGMVLSRLEETGSGAIFDIPASFVIDCTGLEADLREHRVIADLLDHSGAGRNPLGGLDVDRRSAVRGTESEPGLLYATGSTTVGGYLVGVDSFLGLQLAALDVVDDLARQGFGRRIGVARSVSQWWRRMKWREP